MKKFLLLLACALPFIGMAQSSKKTRKDSTVVIIFNDNSNGDEKKKSTGEDNIVKIAPLGFINGTFPIYFERRINDFFTVQGGVGLTSRNYMRSWIRQAANVDFGTDNEYKDMVYPWDPSLGLYDEADRTFDFTHRKANLGFMVSVQPRLYFESDAPDGAFLGLSFDYGRYNFSIPGMVYNTNTFSWEHKGATKKEYENLSDFMVYWGYQSIFDKLTVEYTTGLGFRSVKGEKYAFNSSGTTPTEGFATYKQSTFNFNIGIKVGYHF